MACPRKSAHTLFSIHQTLFYTLTTRSRSSSRGRAAVFIRLRGDAQNSPLIQAEAVISIVALNGHTRHTFRTAENTITLWLSSTSHTQTVLGSGIILDEMTQPMPNGSSTLLPASKT